MKSSEADRARWKRYKQRKRAEKDAAFLRSRRLGNLRYYGKSQKNDAAKGLPYTPWEDNLITKKNKPADSVLSRILGRSVQSIQMRRSTLGKGGLR